MQEREYQSTQPVVLSGGSAMRLVIVGAFSLLVMTALLLYEVSAVAAVIASAVFFTLAYVTDVALTSPVMAAYLVTRQEQMTLRQLHQLQYRVEHLPEPHHEFLRLPSADPVQPPTAAPMPSGRFVSPVDDSAHREAVAFVLQLYGADGLPDESKVILNTSNPGHEGRLRVGKPSKEALDWLVSRGIIQPITHRGNVNGYRLNTILCPTLSDARAKLQSHPVPPTLGG